MISARRAGARPPLGTVTSIRGTALAEQTPQGRRREMAQRRGGARS